MFKTPLILVFFCLVLSGAVAGQQFIQQSFDIPDSIGLTAQGLTVGFHIVSEKEKEVSDKGNFSRYSIQFYIINSTPEAKIVLYKDGWQAGDASPNLVQFDCANATGARFTSKSVSLQAAPCSVLASVEDKDCATGKTVTNKRWVQIGYWIKPGQTISARAIMITPLNEYPAIRATMFPNTRSIVGNASVMPANGGMAGAGGIGGYAGASGGGNGGAGPNGDPAYGSGGNNGVSKGMGPGSANGTGYGSGGPLPGMVSGPGAFYKIRNVWKNTYLNNEKGPLVSTPIGNGWHSAQWKLVSILNSTAYLVKNMWKGNFLSTADPNSMLSADYNLPASQWVAEPVNNSSAVRLKNLGDGTYLNTESGRLQATRIRYDAQSSWWTVEP